MSVMSGVSKENWTMWTSVYDLTNGDFRIAYSRHFDEPFVDQLQVSH
jgi:hypothetical protein